MNKIDDFKIYFDTSNNFTKEFTGKTLKEQIDIFMEIIEKDPCQQVEGGIADDYAVIHFLSIDYKETVDLIKTCDVKQLLFLNEYLYYLVQECPKQELIVAFEDRQNEIFDEDLDYYLEQISFANGFLNSRKGKRLIKKKSKMKK
jgi:hypothetical protein